MTRKKPSGYTPFTVEEANELIPQLGYKFGVVIDLIDQLERDMRLMVQLGVEPSPDIADVRRGDSREVKRAKRKIKTIIAQIFRHYSTIQDTGVIIQDISAGVVSFYTYFGEHPAFLTWQFGESEVTWWHEVYEDSAKRKPLPRSGSMSAPMN